MSVSKVDSALKHRYSNEAGKANPDIYDDLKLKKTFDVLAYINLFQHFVG